MKLITILLLIVALFTFVNQSDKLKSTESLKVELNEKIAMRDAISNQLRQAQANAPSCGGRKMTLVISDETKNEIKELDKEISELRNKIRTRAASR